MEMEIVVKVRTIYGTTRYRPVNDQAIDATKLTKTTNLSKHHLQILSEMGFTISLQQETLDF